MGQNYSARLGSGARGEKDLREVISSDGLIGKGLMVGQGQVAIVASDTRAGLLGAVGQILQIQRDDGSVKRRFARRGNHQLGGCSTCNTSGKIESGAIVDGDDNRAAQEASPEGGHPFGAIGAPKQDAITGANAALLQIVRKAEGNCRQFSVGPRFTAVSPALNRRHIAAITAK